MAQARPSTPANVARELRRRAGFGCCRCGLPVYQYHHIVPWHIENHFRVDDMMVLCPYCHDAATKGALSQVQQRAIQASPFNMRQGFASGALLVNQPYVAVACGGTLLVGDGSAITVDGVDLLRLNTSDYGELQLSMNLKDDQGTTIALVERNEWLSGDPSVWDMTSDHDRLKVWSASRKIVLQIDARATPVFLRADLWHAGQLVRLNSTGISWNGTALSGGGIYGLALVGMSLDLDTDARSLQMRPYLGNGGIVSEPDPVKRLSNAVNAWRQLTGEGGGGALFS